MKPYYYQDKYATIYHGNCLELLPDMPKVDLVLTDPPYGIGVDKTMAKQSGTQYGKAAAPKKQYESTGWDDSVVSQEFMDIMVLHCTNACIWGGNYYSFKPSSSWLVWDKENGTNGFADCELAWTNYGCAVRMRRHLWNGMLRKGREMRSHPTQKPKEIMEWCINICPIEPQTILDPFMGSGTTLVAAKQLNRQAIGIEIEEKYCEIAAQRLSQEVLDFRFSINLF